MYKTVKCGHGYFGDIIDEYRANNPYNTRFMTDEDFVVVANAPAEDVGREEVREGDGGAQEGERRKGQRGGSVPPPVVVPTCRLRGRWVWQDS